MRQGQRIKKVSPGRLLGWKRANQIIESVNAFLNLKVNPKGKLNIGEENAVLDLLESASTSSVAADSGLFHPFKVYHPSDSFFNVFQVRNGLFQHRPWYFDAGGTYTSHGSKVEKPIFYVDFQGSDGVATSANGWDWFNASEDAGSYETVNVGNTGDWGVTDLDKTGRFILDDNEDDFGAIRASFWLQIIEDSEDGMTFAVKARMWSAESGGALGRTNVPFPDGPLVIPLAMITPRDISVPPSDSSDLVIEQIQIDHALDRVSTTSPPISLPQTDTAFPMRFRGVYGDGNEWGLTDKIMYPGDCVSYDSDPNIYTDTNSDTLNAVVRSLYVQTGVNVFVAPSHGSNGWIKISGLFEG